MCVGELWAVLLHPMATPRQVLQLSSIHRREGQHTLYKERAHTEDRAHTKHIQTLYVKVVILIP